MNIQSLKIQFRYKTLPLLLAGGIALASCDHDDDRVIPVEPSYPDPQENLETFRQQLQSSANGWEGTLSPQPGKLYTIFLELDASGNALMYADADTTAAKAPTNTPYAVQLTQSVNPSLMFETGSHLDRIPGAGNNPGVDKTYSFRYSKGDTLFLLGNQYGDALRLVKASKTDRDRYHASGLRSSIREITAYLSAVRFLYIQPEPDKLIQFITNPVSKGIYVTYLNSGAKFFGSDYAYSLDGIRFKQPLQTQAYTTGELFWDENIHRLYTIYNGSRIDLQASTMPVIPLHYLLGHEYPAGTALPSPYSGALPGWSSRFQNIWTKDDDGLWALDMSLYYVVPNLHIDDNTMDLYIYFVNADDVYSKARFPYRFSKTEDGIFTFTPLPLDDSAEGQNAKMLKDHLTGILGVINGNRFRIEFYDAYEELGGVIPQYISVDDSELFFTGLWYQ